jgi:hypothetical protein
MAMPRCAAVAATVFVIMTDILALAAEAEPFFDFLYHACLTGI